MTTARSVLVTGGNGFIGRHLVRRLLESGCSVTLLQRSRDRVDPRSELLHVDRLDAVSIVAALKGRRFEQLFHLAGAGVRPDERDAATIFQVNVEATYAIVRMAAEWAPRAIVIAGSGAEYRLDGVRGSVAEG